jgi:hypothetical protein
MAELHETKCSFRNGTLKCANYDAYQATRADNQTTRVKLQALNSGNLVAQV